MITEGFCFLFTGSSEHPLAAYYKRGFRETTSVMKRMESSWMCKLIRFHIVLKSESILKWLVLVKFFSEIKNECFCVVALENYKQRLVSLWKLLKSFY